MVVLNPGGRHLHRTRLMQTQVCNQNCRARPRKMVVNPLLPSYSMRTVPCVYVSLPQAVGKTLIANRALPCNVWECPHYPPAWQGDLRPIFSWAFHPPKNNGASAGFYNFFI